MRPIFLVFVGTAIVSLQYAPAHAAPDLAEEVYAPYVTKGEFEGELHSGTLTKGDDKGSTGAVAELGYSINDRVSVAIQTDIEREAGGDTRLEGLGVETLISTGRLPFVGVDTGLYAEVGHGLGGSADNAELKAIFAKQAGPWETRLNLIASRPLSGHAKTAFGYAALSDFALTGRPAAAGDGDDDDDKGTSAGLQWRIGVEAIGDFSEENGGGREEFVGPETRLILVHTRLVGKVEFEAGYLMAVGDRRDDAQGLVRVGLSFERKF